MGILFLVAVYIMSVSDAGSEFSSNFVGRTIAYVQACALYGMPGTYTEL